MSVRLMHVKRNLKQVPLPKGTSTIKEITQHIKLPLAPAPNVHTALGSTSVDPELLSQPEGVWYNVQRTRAGNLPVYTDYNNAGGVWTEIRKIEGSAPALRNDLKAILNISKKDIWVQPTAPRVVIKGDFSQRVKQILGEHF